MKILIIKPSSFGDIIQANPTLAALKKEYPDAEISWLVFDRWADIVSLFPDVDHMIVWKRDGGIKEYIRIIRQIRREKFDIVIDLQGLARTAPIVMLSGAKKKIGVPGLKEGSWLLMEEVFPESRSMNAVYRSLETVRFLTGQKTSEPRFNVTVPASIEEEGKDILSEAGIRASDQLIGIVPGVRGKAKEWPIGHYSKLLNMLFAKYNELKIVILGGDGDFYVLQESGAVNLCGKTSLGQLATILKACRVVTGGDTGPVHMAASLGVPVVVMFGGSDVQETAPVTPAATILKKDFSCSPCRGRVTCTDYPCLSTITPDEVLNAISRWLE